MSNMQESPEEPDLNQNIDDNTLDTSSIKEVQKSDFPGYLKNIYKPPPKLFFRGSIPVAEKYITIVGPRKPSNYAKQVCRDIVESLRDYPICIVSGLAYGIDAVAHATAIECNISCIAFPGSGIEDLVLYPQYNFDLAQSILEHGGALMCQWPTSTRAAPWTFPSRNRLMAGIADAVIIIEASDKSGTLITARYALDEGRDVFVVPADITRLEAYGSNSLIQMGAHPIISVDNIPELLGLYYPELDAIEVVSNVQENTILKNLQSEMTSTQISEATNLSISKIISELQELEIQGLIERAGPYWRRK